MTALLAHLAGPRGATGSCDGTLSIQLPNGIRTDRLTNLIFQLFFFFCRISYFLPCACVVSHLFHIGVPFLPSGRCTRRRAFVFRFPYFCPIPRPLCANDVCCVVGNYVSTFTMGRGVHRFADLYFELCERRHD